MSNVGSTRPVPIHERKRRAARDELIDVALDLFVENGYEETTVDDIAAAAGISRRTFFRYFATKDEVVLGKYDDLADRFVEALAARPDDEPEWESLRRTFDSVPQYFDDPDLRSRSEKIEQVLQATPSLRVAFVEKVSRPQALLVATLEERLADSTNPAEASLRANVIVGAAFACLIAAQTTWRHAPSRGFAEILDEAMSTIPFT
jgi:AcrR family transcriptional regulator